MKTGEKFLWKSPFRRWCAVALACIMILTLAAPLPTLAYGTEAAPGALTEEPEPVEPSPPGEETPGDGSGEPEDIPPLPEEEGPPVEEAPSEEETPPEEEVPPPEDEAAPSDDTTPPEEDTPPENSGDPVTPPDQTPEDQQPCPHNGGDDCALCVTGWAWQEDPDLEGALVWRDDLGLWTLGLPGLDETVPLTWDLLLPLLPQAVEVTTASGETKVIPLVWSQDAKLEDAMAPEGVTVTASLDPQAGDYALTTDAPKLAVLVAAGGGEGDADPNVLRMKFLNKWYFIGRIVTDRDGNLLEEIDVLEDPATITVAITDLPNRSNAEIKKWIEDTGLLPTRLGGWIPPETEGTRDPRLKWLGYIKNSNKTDDCYEMTSTGDKPDKSVGEWGNFPIDEWNFDALMSKTQHQDGEIVPIVACTVEKQGEDLDKDPHPYRLYVNSNNQADYAGIAAGNPGSKADTRTNPDILTLNIKLVDVDLDDYIVDRVANPGNVRVNLFDYWVADYGENPVEPQGDILDEGDVHYRGKNDGTAAESTNFMNFSSKDQWNLGINQGHLLIFGDGIIHAGLWNKGAGQSTAYGKAYAGMEGIVKSVLGEDGYPVINTENARKQMMGVTDPNAPDYRNHQLIGDYVLAGDHIGDIYYTDINGTKSPYQCDNINNLSETVIGTWGGDLDKDVESLNYLFDPTVTDPHKKIYTDVKGLFQINDDGYYYYNMRNNFAEFVEGTQTDPEKPNYDPNRFILYDAGATTRTDGTKSIGNFFPFNKGAEVFNILNDDGSLGSTVPCDHNTMNHHLGMTVEVDFRQPANGKINTGDGGGTPMTFGFSGDDDVWIFIDDVLVLDLGGTHSEIYGTIDFSNGEVCVGRAFDSKGIPSDPKDPANLVTQTTLKAQYEKAGLADATQWRGNTFASNTSHTLKMFYLERGNYDSSIALNFNLQPLLHQRIVKVDQNGKPVEGVGFSLLEAEEVSAGTSGAIQCLYTDSGERGKIFYVKKKDDTPLVTLETAADGSAVFMTEDGQYFNFADRGDQYYVLKETTPPEGYRDLPEDIVLHYDSATSMLSVANRWTTGAYACSVSNVTAATSLTYGKVEDKEVKPGTESVPEEEQEKGIAVAVPLMRRKADKSWFALYGSNLQSFQPVSVGLEGTESQWRNAILRAAIRQAGANDTAGWYLEWDDGDHRLTGTLFDLPGLANRYLLNDPVNGDLHMVYGIIDSATLAGLGITGDTAAARYESLREYIRENEEETAFQALLGGFRFLNLNQFNRDFRSLIYIPNERRELQVLKIDQDGQPLAGTEFTLYYAADGSERAKGVTDANGMLVFSPTGDNTIPGQAKAVWANASADARYYLQETKAPAGYDLNPTRIPVVVGYYSIYADAGTPGDGVSVMAGVGTLTQTMRQYAISDEVDVTLQDITATMQIQDAGRFDLAGWRDAKLSGTSIPRTMNLHFKKNTTDREDYGLHDEDGGKVYTPYFITDTGYIRTRIKQNWAALNGGQYEGASIDANKENLYDTDLTNLFSMVNIIVVGDRTDEEITTGSLTISKDLIGPGLTETDYARPFYFTVELRDANGAPLPGHYQYRFYGEDKTGEIANGERLILRHDEAVTILGLPAGTQYTVTEAVEEGWYPDPPSGSHTGTIPRDETAEAPFTNSKEPPEGSSSSSSSSSSSGGSRDDDDDDDHYGGGSSGSSQEGDASRIAGRPYTGDETETDWWASLSVLFLVGIAVICLAQYSKRLDPESEEPQGPSAQP